MASSVLRIAVHALLAGAPGLEALGYPPESVAPNFSLDGPGGDKFLVLRWGITNRGVGVVNQVRLSVWAYNRQADYGPIEDALTIIKAVLPTLAGVVMAPGQSVLAVDYAGDSDDLYDDGYQAYTRWCSHTITASGS